MLATRSQQQPRSSQHPRVRAGSPGSTAAPHGPARTHQRVLAVLCCDGAAPRLDAELRRLEIQGDAVDVFVVAPTLTSRLRFWCNDDGEAIVAATNRVDEALAQLHVGGEVQGQVGDPDPLLAIGDALPGFPADRLILATGAAAQHDWRERRLIGPVRRFGRPVTHLAAPRPPSLGAEPPS